MKDDYNQKYFENRDILIHHIAEALKNFMLENNLQSILDVGCGTGRLVKFLNDHGFNTHGCDSSQEAVKKAHIINKPSLIIKSSASKLPFGANSFDLVSAISVIEHLKPKEAKQFLAESRRVLKPHGFIFLITPNLATPLRHFYGKKWFAYQDPTHINLFTPQKLSKLLEKSGFSDLRTRFLVLYRSQFDKEFPSFFKHLPKIFKKNLIYLLFNSPLYIIRDSIWVSAQKND